MKYNCIVIDGNNLYWRSTVHALEQYLIIQDVQVYCFVIQQFFERLNQLLDKYAYKDSRVFILFDNPLSKINIRKIISENYKHPRELKDMPKDLYKTLNILIEILKNYSSYFYILKEEAFEADDLTKPILEHLITEGNNRCLFISADMDWARNITKCSNWFNFVDVYNPEIFYKKYGFNPVGKKIQLWKALKGDTSDNIENPLPYLPENILLDILTKYNDLADLYKGLWKEDYPQQWKIKIKENEIQIKINYQLTDFVEVKKDLNDIMYKCTENIKILKFWFELLQLPLEGRMMNKKDKKKFFAKKKIRRLN
jgi:hypothetical protein